MYDMVRRAPLWRRKVPYCFTSSLTSASCVEIRTVRMSVEFGALHEAFKRAKTKSRNLCVTDHIGTQEPEFRFG